MSSYTAASPVASNTAYSPIEAAAKVQPGDGHAIGVADAQAIPPSSPPSVRLLKVLRLPEEDESPASTAPGSPELPASLLFEDINDVEARGWSLEADAVDAKLSQLNLGDEELDPLSGLEGLSLTW